MFVTRTILERQNCLPYLEGKFLLQELYTEHGIPYSRALHATMLPYLDALPPKIAALKTTTGLHLQAK